MATPSQALASKIVQRLSDEKLLLSDDAQTLRTKLASGKMATEDWQLAIEQAADQHALSTKEPKK